MFIMTHLLEIVFIIIWCPFPHLWVKKLIPLQKHALFLFSRKSLVKILKVDARSNTWIKITTLNYTKTMHNAKQTNIFKIWNIA